MKKLWFILSFTVLIVACCKDEPNDSDPQEGPTPYTLNLPAGWPAMDIPEDNPLTVEGVSLGKMLFYEPLLSANNTQACASCHNQKFAFTDEERQFSLGETGAVGTRNSMPLFNIGWGDRMLWDGKGTSLEAQIRLPILADFEMNEDTVRMVSELLDNPVYVDRFEQAFGTREITMDLVAKAMAQFIRTMISTDSRFDRDYGANQNRIRTAILQPQNSIERGMRVFFTETGDCFHCHGNPGSLFFTNYGFKNNGLDSIFDDLGLGGVTGIPNEDGLFKVPSVRNLVFTAPYMHDGRFQTLEEVIDFYNDGLKHSRTLDPNLAKHFDENNQVAQPPRMTEQDKEDLLNFMLSLTDSTFINNPEFASPF